ncbi:MAG: hypothetical protein DYG96_00120 [Chlorobi bacterium CHB2]|nr:hypothetical protein [Chlorobi bacterium CHB2]
MKPQLIIAAALLTLGIAACNESTTEPTPQPSAETMQFKSGARYEYTTYSTDTTTQAPIESTRRTKTRTLVAANASVKGKTGVAVSIDSLFATAGGFLSVTDSVLLQQASGTNEIYRYSSLAPELDFSGIAGLSLDIGSDWRHEATLGATTAKWFLGEVADTFQIDGLPPQVKGVKVSVSDSAIASASETLTIDGVSYKTTKTTHRLDLKFSVIVNLGFGGDQVVALNTNSITRTTWTSAELGAIIREEREAKAINLGSYTGITLPVIPAYGSVTAMTKVLAKGS